MSIVDHETFSDLPELQLHQSFYFPTELELTWLRNLLTVAVKLPDWLELRLWKLPQLSDLFLRLLSELEAQTEEELA